jgi:hypothetical protein
MWKAYELEGIESVYYDQYVELSTRIHDGLCAGAKKTSS